MGNGTAGRETTKLQLPEVPAGVVGVIKGTVGLPVEQMKAIRMDERLLFIPVVAVNALYDYGEDRTGQTGRSYLIGRETDASAEKMGLKLNEYGRSRRRPLTAVAEELMVTS